MSASPPFSPSSSLARRMLLQMALRIGAVILLGTGLGYWYSYRSHEQDTLGFLSKYATARGEAESELFIQAEINSRRMRDEFVRRLNVLGNQDVDADFHRLIAQDPDGIYRVRPAMSDFAHKASVAILPTADMTPEFQREVLTAYAIASEFGPPYRNRYYDTFFPLHGNDVVVMYLPDTDYSRSGGRDMLLVDYASEVGSSPQNNPKRATYWTDVYYDEVVRQWMVSVATPIDYGGHWVGGTGHDVPIQQLVERTNSIHIPGTYNLIVSRKGQLIAHRDWSQAIARAGGVIALNKTLHPTLFSIFSAARDASPDKNVVSTADGSLYLGVSDITGPDWLFITVYPKALLSAHARDMASVLLVIGGASLLLEILILAYILRRQVSQPLGHLLHAIQALSRDEAPGGLDAGRRDEIGQLIRAFTDMSETITHQRHGLESQVKERTSQLQALFDANPLAVAKVENGTITALNDAAMELLGYSERALIGQSIEHLFPSPDAYRECLEEALPVLETGRIYQSDRCLTRANGTTFWASVHGKAIDPARLRDGATVWIFEDISVRRELEDKMRHMAQHDPLTGLANRALLYDLLNQLLSMAHRQKRSLAVLFLDLDNFKPVNDRYGHEAGDQVLCEVAARLQGCVRETDAVGRVGGDEFVVLLFDIRDRQDVARIAHVIVSQLASPIRVCGHDAALSTSIGISLYPKDGDNADALINKADVAMYQAKDSGKNRYCFFENRAEDTSVDS